MNHEALSDLAIKALSGIEGVTKIISFGSVKRKKVRPESDIDIAVIIDDLFRGLPMLLDGSCMYIQEEIDKIKRSLPTDDVRMHIVMYWESEYEAGIRLEGNKYPGYDLLHEVGEIKYNFD